jgi:hypothetical protein
MMIRARKGLRAGPEGSSSDHDIGSGSCRRSAFRHARFPGIAPVGVLLRRSHRSSALESGMRRSPARRRRFSRAPGFPAMTLSDTPRWRIDLEAADMRKAMQGESAAIRLQLRAGPIG